MVNKKSGLKLVEASGKRALPVFHQDELSKAFG